MWIEEIYVTDLGKALLAKTPAGVPVPVTRWQIGQGVLPAEQRPEQQTQLWAPIKYLPLAEVRNSGNQSTVTGQFINTGMEAFVWEEVGLFATDPDKGEILYAYGNARGNGEPIQAGADQYREAIFGVQLVFDTAANVAAVIDESLIFITISQKGRPNGVATLDSKGKVPVSQLPDDIGISAIIQAVYNGGGS